MLMPIREASKILGLSGYELRQGIHEGRYPGYWTRNKKRLLVDAGMIEECISREMEETQMVAKAAYHESHPGRWDRKDP